MLVITDAIRGSSKKEMYEKLGSEFSKDRKWMKKLCYLYKIIYSKRLSHFPHLIPLLQISHRRNISFQFLLYGTDFFPKNSFLPSTINEWNKLELEITGINPYIDIWKKLCFIKGTEIKTFSVVEYVNWNEPKFRKFNTKLIIMIF